MVRCWGTLRAACKPSRVPKSACGPLRCLRCEEAPFVDLDVPERPRSMLRLAVIALLLANAGYYAWSQGLLKDWGFAPEEQAEPQRMNQQIRPETLQILRVTPSKTSPSSPSSSPPPPPPSPPGTATASADVASSAASSPPPADTAECLQAGVFDERQADAPRTPPPTPPPGSRLPAPPPLPIPPNACRPVYLTNARPTPCVPPPPTCRRAAGCWSPRPSRAAGWSTWAALKTWKRWIANAPNCGPARWTTTGQAAHWSTASRSAVFRPKRPQSANWPTWATRACARPA